MIQDPALLSPDGLDERLHGLFRDGRVFFVRLPGLMESGGFEPLCVSRGGHHLGVVCTAGQLDSPGFAAWLRAVGTSREQVGTVSVSNVSSFMTWVLMAKLRQPMLTGLLINPPDSATLALGPGHEADADYMLMMPTVDELRRYWMSRGNSAAEFEEIVAAAGSSKLSSSATSGRGSAHTVEKQLTTKPIAPVEGKASASMPVEPAKPQAGANQVDSPNRQRKAMSHTPRMVGGWVDGVWQGDEHEETVLEAAARRAWDRARAAVGTTSEAEADEAALRAEAAAVDEASVGFMWGVRPKDEVVSAKERREARRRATAGPGLPSEAKRLLWSTTIVIGLLFLFLVGNAWRQSAAVDAKEQAEREALYARWKEEVEEHKRAATEADAAAAAETAREESAQRKARLEEWRAGLPGSPERMEQYNRAVRERDQ